jgi:hypothetical protein
MKGFSYCVPGKQDFRTKRENGIRKGLVPQSRAIA